MRWFVIPIFIIACCIGVLINNQRQIIREAEIVRAMGKPLMAVSLYERVLLNYIPFSPYNKKAVEGIEQICKVLNDKNHKLFCEETLRSSLYQIRGFYTPYKDKIKETEKRILLLKTELYIEHNNPPQDDYEKIYKDLKKMMEYDRFPSNFWSAVAVFSLLGWISALLVMIFKGLGSPIDKKYILIGIVGFVLFFGIWIIGLYMA